MPNHQAVDGDVKLVLSNARIATFKYLNCTTEGSGSSWSEALFSLHRKLRDQLRINPDMQRYFDSLVKDVCKKADIKVPEWEEPVLEH